MDIYDKEVLIEFAKQAIVYGDKAVEQILLRYYGLHVQYKGYPCIALSDTGWILCYAEEHCVRL